MNDINIPVTDRVFWEVLTAIVVFIVGFTVVKVDLSWIKNRIKRGDRKFESHDRRLNAHNAEISAIKSICSAHHGTAFPSIPNGKWSDE